MFLRGGLFDPAPDLAVADVSFISLTAVLGPLVSCLRRPADIVALVKPQFELEPKKVPKGVVRDPAFRAEALARVRTAAESLGLHRPGEIESPVKGAKGNVEFLLRWSAPG